jgi:hypothetical protein
MNRSREARIDLAHPMLTKSPPQMSASEIVRELRRLRFDPANGRGRSRKVPLKCVAEHAGALYC